VISYFTILKFKKNSLDSDHEQNLIVSCREASHLQNFIKNIKVHM